MTIRGDSTGRPTAAPAVWPMPGHRTVAEWTPGYWRAMARQRQADHIHALLRRGLKQYQVAERMNLSPGRVSQIVCKTRKQRSQHVTNGAGV